MCQSLCQALCMQGLILSYYSALTMTDFRRENQCSEEGSIFPQVPSHNREKRIFCGVAVCLCDMLLPPFTLRQLSCESLLLENIHCAAISAFPLILSWCKERENIRVSVLNNRKQIFIFLKRSSLVKNDRRTL